MSESTWSETVQSLALEIQETSVREKLLELSGDTERFKALLMAAEKGKQVVEQIQKKKNLLKRCGEYLVNRVKKK